MFESLRSISDHTLLSETDAIVVQDRRLTLELLAHLHEIERRQLYLERGYASMFDFCTRHLRFSDSAAMRRLRSARCMARYPQICDLLERGELNLSTVALVSKVLTPDNVDRLLGRISGKSQREVESVVAEFEPRMAIPPDRIRTIMVPVSEGLSLRHTDEYNRCGGRISFSGSAHGPAEGTPTPSESPAIAAPRMERCAVIQFAASDDFMQLLGRVRSLASHRLATHMSLEHVFTLVMREFVKRNDPALRDER